ncbi:MAG: RDD family protein [Bacteroidia bacterium]|nr:RDD family protein [Bacteroidia bacterium]
MTTPNPFITRFSQKTDAQLKEVVDDREGYHENAVMAAIEILRDRGVSGLEGVYEQVVQEAKTSHVDRELELHEKELKQRLGVPVVPAAAVRRIYPFLIDRLIIFITAVGICALPFWRIMTYHKFGPLPSVPLNLWVLFGVDVTYYTFCEAKLMSTLGKRVTNLVTLQQNGTRITPQTALIRSFLRWIPIDVLWVLNGQRLTLHDKLTKTYTIHKSDLKLATEKSVGAEDHLIHEK